MQNLNTLTCDSIFKINFMQSKIKNQNYVIKN